MYSLTHYPPESHLLTLNSDTGQLALLDYLLSLSAIDVDAGNSSHCGTALHAAVRGEYLTIIHRLFHAGANIAATAAKGSTPLHLAADNGDVELIK